MTKGHRLRSFETQDRRSDSPLSTTRRLIELRRSEPALRQGTLQLLEGEPQILAFERSFSSAESHETVITCVFNPTARAYDWTFERSVGCLIDSSDPLEIGSVLTFPPQSWALFKRDI